MQGENPNITNHTEIRYRLVHVLYARLCMSILRVRVGRTRRMSYIYTCIRKEFWYTYPCACYVHKRACYIHTYKSPCTSHFTYHIYIYIPFTYTKSYTCHIYKHKTIPYITYTCRYIYRVSQQISKQ